MSKKNRGHGGGHGNSERWLMTYADLMNNLLALFIVMYMMGVTDLTKFQKVVASFAVTFGNSAVTEAAANTPDMINEADMDEESLNAILAASEGAAMPEIIPSEEEEEAAAEEEAEAAEAEPEGEGEAAEAEPESEAEATEADSEGEAESETTPETTEASEDSAAPDATSAPSPADNTNAKITGAAAGGGVSMGLDGTGDAYDELVYRISDLLKAKGYDKNVTVEKGGDYIYLRFREGVLFFPDEAVMKDGASTVLSNIATVIMDSYDLISNIDISGHTARISYDLPTRENLFSWELSTNRALTVLEYLVRRCDMPQDKLSVTGNSCNKLYVEGDSEEYWAQNRRVEIRLTRAVSPDVDISVSSDPQASADEQPQEGQSAEQDEQSQENQDVQEET